MTKDSETFRKPYTLSLSAYYVREHIFFQIFLAGMKNRLYLCSEELQKIHPI